MRHAAKTERGALYLDASALVKLVIAEPESQALITQVDGRALISSELSLTEVPRAVRRVLSEMRSRRHRRVLEELNQTLRAADLVPVSRDLLLEAAELPDPHLRTMDAVHVASAGLVAGALEAMVTYDRRQQSAAERAGITVLAPGSG